MILRRATVDDAAMLEEWRTRAHVLAAFGTEEPPNWREELSIDEDWHDPVIAEIDGRPIGYMEIIDPAREATHYWGEIEPNLRAIDIFIADKSDLRKGYGRRMMALALARCFGSSRVTAVIIDPLASNRKAIRFYERLGFQHLGNRFFGNDDNDENECAVMRLDRSAWERSQAYDLTRVQT
ncbi:MAG: GNAT family N-acetyltransferase [Pseudomonadota bacterium]